MAINPLYIPLFTIEEVILDKDSGLPLSGGVVRFYRDSQRLTPKPVYQISGVSPNYMFVSVGTELTLGIAGDFVDLNGNPMVPYAYPYDSDGNVDLYYVTVVNQGGVPQFVRQAVPYIPPGGFSPSDLGNDGNQISNPQFVESIFPRTGTTTIAVAGSNTVTPIAPGWDLVTTGSGNVVVEILKPTASNVPTNPPFALRILADSALGSTVILRQRLLNSPSIFRGGFASAMFSAAVLSGGGSAISLTYAPSTGTNSVLIPNTAIPTDGAYHVIQGNAQITVQNNDPASTGYVDINITIPTARSIAITSIQVIGLAFSTDVDFEEETAARQKDHLFHYYEDAAVRQSKDSILTGWNFGNNPWQFFIPDLFPPVASNTYTADQTILIQQNYVEANVGNNVSVGRSHNAGENEGYQVEAVTAHNQFAILQYLASSATNQFFGQKMSCMVRALLVAASKTCRVKVRLIYKTTSPSSLSRQYPILNWTEGSDPVFHADFTVLKPIDDPAFTLTSVFTSSEFIQFQMPSWTNDTTVFGLVVYTIDNIDQPSDYIVFNDISLVPNDFGLATQAESPAVTLMKCQYYFEKSYDPAIQSGTASQTRNSFSAISNASVTAANINASFKTVKRVNPNITWYSPVSGAVNNIANLTAAADIVVSATNNNGVNATGYPTLAGAPGANNILLAHWTADSRLGT